MHIVIEGQDATGKDTQATLLAEHLRSQGKTVVHYAESGTASQNPFIADIARLNYIGDYGIEHRTRVLLYLVNRYEQWRKLAEPALRNGDIVITTRCWYSTLIYEGYAAGVSRPLIIRLHKEVMPTPYFHPDRSVIMTLSDADRAARRQSQGRSEVYKDKDADFQQKINRAYLKVAKDYSVPTLDAAGTPDEVQKRLRELFHL